MKVALSAIHGWWVWHSDVANALWRSWDPSKHISLECVCTVKTEYTIHRQN